MEQNKCLFIRLLTVYNLKQFDDLPLIYGVNMYINNFLSVSSIVHGKYRNIKNR